MRKNNLLNWVIFLSSELICFFVTRIYVSQYLNGETYSIGLTILQFLYFLPVLLGSLTILFETKHYRFMPIYLTIGFILYSIILHIYIHPVASLFSSTSGIISFVEYGFKIYFISLPLIGILIYALKKETTKKCFLFSIFRIVILTLITLIFSHAFALKGILYAWPLNELIYTLVLSIL